MRLDEAPGMKLAAAQAFTAVGGGQVGALPSHDLGDTTPIRDIGAGTPMCLLFLITTAALGATDTFDFQAVTDTDPAMGSPVVFATRRVAKAQLGLGKYVIVPIPPGVANLERYINGRVGVGAADTVSASCWFAPLNDVVQFDRFYASGFRVAS